MRRVVRSASFVALAFASAVGIVAADEEETPAQLAWRERIETQFQRVEMTLTALDKAKGAVGSLLARITAVHKRLLALEGKAQLELGTIHGKDDLSNLTMDVTSLGTRARLIIDSRAPKKPAAPVPPPTPTVAPKPAPPDAQPPGRKWPMEVRFLSTAKIVYQQTGEWFISKNQRSGLGNDFLMDGYAGTIAFSLRASGLRNDVASADIRVAIKLRAPFASDDNTYRIYDVHWAAEKVFNNDSIRNFPRYDEISVPGPIEWIKEPKMVTLPLTAEAYVTKVTLPNGEVVAFNVPEFTPKRN